MAVERNSPEGSKAAERAVDGVEITDTTAEFEEYTSAPRVDDKGQPITKPKGLRASGYQFPPESGPPLMTKANLAKGIGVPEVPRVSPTVVLPNRPIAPPLPGQAPHPSRTGTYESVSAPRIEQRAPTPSVKVDEGAMFEEYHRPDLKDHPKTGKGIRSEAPLPPSAKELLGKWEQPEPQVVVPKRFVVMPNPNRVPGGTLDETQAELDAMADVAAAAPDAVMSSPVAYGPSKVVIHHDEDDRPEPVVVETVTTVTTTPALPVPETAVISPALEPASLEPLTPPLFVPTPTPPTPALVSPSVQIVRASSLHDLPPVLSAPLSFAPVQAPAVVSTPVHMPIIAPTPAPAPAPVPAPPSTPHVSDSPEIDADGPVPRIAIVQCDFNRSITDAMVKSATDEADRVGAPITNVLHVPGVFDSPLAAKRLLEQKNVDAVVVIGCVIQGETGHDELITHAAGQTLLAIACNLDKPVGLGITGPRMTEVQAKARISSGAFAVASVVAQYRNLVRA